MKLDEVILTTVSFVLRARFRFVAIQVARGPEYRVDSRSRYDTRKAKVCHGLAVTELMHDDREQILSACERASIVSAVERGEKAL